MFSDLQLVAMTAERERLAREMHDGVAQDLVALSFLLDALGRQLRKTSPDAEQSVAQVRSELTRMVSDIRYSISDLRSSVRPERGLGAGLSSQVQSIAASGRLTMHLSLHESTFRLPTQIETTLLRAAQSLATEARDLLEALEAVAAAMVHGLVGAGASTLVTAKALANGKNSAPRSIASRNCSRSPR